MTGGCNEDPAPPTFKDEYLALADNLAYQTGGIAVVIYQIPNCHIVYPSDPSKTPREEDAMIAWAWHEFLTDPKHDPEWLPRLPMAKAGMQCMRAVEEYTKKQGIAEIEGWVVSGASKRGWTTWMVGAVTCESCPTIVGIAPLVPIVPALHQDVHRQWKSYGGFTFAFKDYTAVNLTTNLDGAGFKLMMDIVDPINYGERLARLPKLTVLSSDDEFMQFDWSNIWYDQMTGESNLLIIPNSEHSLTTGIPEIISSLPAVYKSIALQKERPSFDYAYDNTTGEITVTIPEGIEHGKVVLRHAMTLQNKRRDFRWVRLANEDTGNCTLPDIPMKKPIEGGNCIQPIIWLGKTLSAVEGTTNVYKAKPPMPLPGFWTGYYIEVFFPNNLGLKKDSFQFTTPGFVWPDTLPFEDCLADTCKGHLV